ncbi:hypothetical protein BN874_200070 [Candidatus Contendobacter odensis Run_B_J11]|uniref:Uncharacterized protein n=1 Tax=Candidatus Contendobacter odensis Run_B_J11 TaxID=1400861 RepID=A0A7U7J2E8_9GAMM|nr:hypothetical protein BN874_200070 [Candidatus Contendobacter odensis Run_B_J11]
MYKTYSKLCVNLPMVHRIKPDKLILSTARMTDMLKFYLKKHYLQIEYLMRLAKIHAGQHLAHEHQRISL